MARQEYVERLEKALENSRMHIKFLEHAVDSFQNTVSEMRADVLRKNKPTEDDSDSDEPTTAQKAIAQGQKQAAEIAKLKARQESADHEYRVLYDFFMQIQFTLGKEFDLMLVDGREAFLKRLNTLRIDAESTESMSENIEELYEKLRDAEDRYGRLDAMLEQAEGDIDKIATLLGLHHKNEDRKVLISKIRDRIEHVKEERDRFNQMYDDECRLTRQAESELSQIASALDKIRDKIEHVKEERDRFNQMYDDECRLTRQAESELSQIASALDISNENACDVRLKLMLARINDMKQSLTIYGSTDKYRKMLSGLLARLHRDGGHAIERLGIEGATTAADAIISDLLVAKDEAKQNKEAFEAELEGNRKIREILGAHDEETMFELAERLIQRKLSYESDMHSMHDTLIAVANLCRNRKGQLESGDI